MAQHKWHKEIKAWADGKTIQGRWNATMKYVKHDWHDCSGIIDWDFPAHDYRIKPTEKVMQHKWHKEIKAWADGAEIEWRFFCRDFGWTNWISIEKAPSGWDGRLSGKYKFNGDFSSFDDGFELRIKPQPKEPQYLYVFDCETCGIVIRDKPIGDSDETYKGKIPLITENDDE